IAHLRKALASSLLAYGAPDLSTDPVRFPHRFPDRADAEVAAFVAASFAFSNVTRILAFLERMFRVLVPSPHAALTGARPVPRSRVADLSHRFISPAGVHRFLFSVRAVLLAHGSLESLYRRARGRGDGETRVWLSGFLSHFREAWGDALPRERDFLFPDPHKGSACKRHNLFLRWMVREGDGVDLGLWTVLAPRQLIVPVDTHMARLGKWLGLTARNSADWRMAEEITDAFRVVCPEDPVRFDFVLTRVGILKACTHASRGICPRCPLAPACSGATTAFSPRG
ncbi:MAG: TIGR02757 family protein, partial [Thermodesulfobacteriota bacterium]|nr:TIGR02757 family protein [Thermodesulfobacteriota bacterium]